MNVWKLCVTWGYGKTWGRGKRGERMENSKKFFFRVFCFSVTRFTSKSTIFARRSANRPALVPGCLCSIHYARAYARIMRADACAHTYNKFVIHQPATTWTPIDALQLHNAGIAAAATAVACTLYTTGSSWAISAPCGTRGVRWTHKNNSIFGWIVEKMNSVWWLCMSENIVNWNE